MSDTRRGTPTIEPSAQQLSILEIGTDYTLAPLAVRDLLALNAEAAASAARRLVEEPAIDEAVVLSTCNRLEVYLATRAPEEARRQAARAVGHALGALPVDLQALLSVRREREAAEHLCSVASGLQWMIVAEGQILGQVREALQIAAQAGTAGPQLQALFRSAVQCGKLVRAETALGRTEISVGSALVDVLLRLVHDWPAQRVVLVGAGRMNRIAAERLAQLGAADITVISRTLEAAQQLADSVGGRTLPVAALQEAAAGATLLISATRSPNYMLTAQMLDQRGGAPLLAVDLAVPRDIDPAVRSIPGVRLLDIDDLRGTQDRDALQQALEAASLLVDLQVEDWQVQRRIRAAVPIIADLRAHVDSQKDMELARTLSRLEQLPAEAQDEVRELAHRLVNKMFHHLATRMKQAAAHPQMGEQYLDTARFLFTPAQRIYPGTVPADTVPAATPAADEGNSLEQEF